jgi:hypothetical protein
MNRHKKGTKSILLSIVLILAGCKSVESPENLIHPPQLEDEQKQQLHVALEKFLPSKVELLSPIHGATKKSIYFEDVDNDDQLEAFVFYKGKEENRQIHLLVLQKDRDDWKKVSDTETSYYELDYVGLYDLDNDGQKELITGMGMSDFETEKQLDIYEWKDQLQRAASQSYDVVDIADFTQNQKIDIVLIQGKRRESYQARLLTYENQELKSHSVVSLDSYAFHENIVSGKLMSGDHALFLDSGVGAHSMITEIISYDNTKRELLLLGNDLQIKEYPLYSRDINDDGVIEVGEMYIPKGWENSAFAEIPFIEVYSSISIDGVAHKVAERYTNHKERFYIDIPIEWHGKVTIEKLIDGIQILDVDTDEIVFEIKWMDKDSGHSVKNIVRETKDTIFYTTHQENPTFPNAQFYLLENEF